MSDDLITSLRALAAARHDDLSIAVDAVIEIERQRAEIERLRAALEGIRIDGPDAHGLVWATIQHPSIATRSHAMIGNMERMVSQALLEFEQMRRNALEGKP